MRERLKRARPLQLPLGPKIYPTGSKVSRTKQNVLKYRQVRERLARRGLGSCLARGLERWRVYALLSRGPQEELMRRRMSTYIARMRLSGRGTTAKNASACEAHTLNEAGGNLPFALIGEHNARIRLALAAWHACTWSTRATRSRSRHVCGRMLTYADVC